MASSFTNPTGARNRIAWRSVRNCGKRTCLSTSSSTLTGNRSNSSCRQKGTPPANAPNPNAPVFYINGAPFDGTGVEGEMKYTTERWGTFFANADFMSGTSGDLVVEQPTGFMNYNYRYVPAYTLKAGATRQWGPFGASTSFDHSGATQGAFGPVDPWTDVQANVWFEHPAKGVTLRHTFSGRNLLNSDIAFPEYSRRKANVNELPYGADPGFFYTLGIRF